MFSLRGSGILAETIMMVVTCDSCGHENDAAEVEFPDGPRHLGYFDCEACGEQRETYSPEVDY